MDSHKRWQVADAGEFDPSAIVGQGELYLLAPSHMAQIKGMGCTVALEGIQNRVDGAGHADSHISPLDRPLM
ncbi:hypothetical protein D3C81_1788440 [compost metagenome]